MERELQTKNHRNNHISCKSVRMPFVYLCVVHVLQPQPSRNKYFDNFNTFNTPSMMDPVDEWLNSPPITTVTDGLQWWMAMAASGHPLSGMGIDFLSIPGMF
jgi:hypothetical protein